MSGLPVRFRLRLGHRVAYGVYFPNTNVTVFDLGQKGRGLPDDPGVEWLDIGDRDTVPGNRAEVELCSPNPDPARTAAEVLRRLRGLAEKLEGAVGEPQ